MTRSSRLLVATCLWLSISATSIANEVVAPAPLDIPYSKFVLDNGLTLIVHEDHKAPIVAVNVWYHVGSKNEKRGKTGFAHLFEHLMFNGSENHDEDYFAPLQRIGATELNGTTNADRTNYFQNVPNTALDLALWLESDRMGHLLGAISQEKLDEQRGVVQNEKRQRENQPYGKIWELLSQHSYPEGHPYSWQVIGSMEDLDAASLEDVRQWFKDYYGAANAVISVAGDVDTETVHTKVIEFFGDIPPGPPIDRPKAWIAERREAKRIATQDRVPQARVIKAWNIPQLGSAEADHLDLASSVLGYGKNSRLYERLVYHDKIATDIAAFVWLREMGGTFVVWATAQPGQDLAHVERVVEEELERFIAKGPTKAELRRIQTQEQAGFVRGIEKVGGFGGKSDILAKSQVYGGSPDAYQARMARIQDATTRNVQRAAQKWLTEGALTIEVHPFPEYATVTTEVDRSKLPEVGELPPAHFPNFERATLSNGMKVIIAERHAVPVVDFDLVLDAGYAADHGVLSGTANLTLDMLDEGTSKRSALEISKELAELGAELGTSSNLDLSSVSLSALRENLDESLDLFAEVILDPAFDAAEFERLRQQQLAGIAREKVTPFEAALRVFPPLLYGEGHAYALPFTGSGTEEDVAKLTTRDLRAYHDRWFKPNNATLIVAGDTSRDEIVPKLEELFRGWKPAEVPEKQIAEVEPRKKSVVYLVNRPGSTQSTLIAGHLAPPEANPDEAAIDVMNQLLGGSFMSRINMNLREDKHWAYGARSMFYPARGQRPFLAFAQVQTDKTADSMREIQTELTEITGQRPPSAEEVSRSKNELTLTLPGRWETQGAVASSVAKIVRFGHPDDYWNEYPEEIRSLDRDDVTAAARKYIHPDTVTWVVVGDMEQVEAPIRALKLGDVHLLDANGSVID